MRSVTPDMLQPREGTENMGPVMNEDCETVTETLTICVSQFHKIPRIELVSTTSAMLRQGVFCPRVISGKLTGLFSLHPRRNTVSPERTLTSAHDAVRWDVARIADRVKQKNRKSNNTGRCDATTVCERDFIYDSLDVKSLCWKVPKYVKSILISFSGKRVMCLF